MWYCQAQLASKIPVLSLLSKALYLGMCELWPFLSSMCECFMEFVFSHSAHLCTSTDTVIDRSFHQHGTCARYSSDWHVQAALAFALCSVPPPLQTWGQCIRTTEILSGHKVMTPPFFHFHVPFWGGRNRFISWCRQMLTVHNQLH